MLELIQRVVARLMNRVDVNQIRQSMRERAPVFVKRRRTGGSLVIWFANRFLALAHSEVEMFVRTDEWIHWEVHCVRLLYPERTGLKIEPGQSLIIPKVRGSSLRQLIRGGRASVQAFVAAARELRRVHQIQCDYYQAGWSHGDLHLDNIVYDSEADRAVLIDFDTRHDHRIGQLQRQSDDLKLILLELITQPGEKWGPFAAAFVEAYQEASVLNELSRQLFVPRLRQNPVVHQNELSFHATD